MFAQEGFQASVGEVAREAEAARAAIGAGADVRRSRGKHSPPITHPWWTERTASSSLISLKRRRHYAILCGYVTEFKAKFDLPVDTGVLYLSRYVTRCRRTGRVRSQHGSRSSSRGYRQPLRRDSHGQGGQSGEPRFSCCGTGIILSLIVTIGSLQLLAEDSQIVGFIGPPEKAEWIDQKQGRRRCFRRAKGEHRFRPGGQLHPQGGRWSAVLRPALEDPGQTARRGTS